MYDGECLARLHTTEDTIGLYMITVIYEYTFPTLANLPTLLVFLRAFLSTYLPNLAYLPPLLASFLLLSLRLGIPVS